MAYYVCPHCGEKSEIFGKSQGDEFASQMDIKFLDSLPLTEEVLKSTEDDSTVVDSYVQSELSEKFISIADKIEEEFL
jgi:ATP-binding protein involved in chromosome partitioning